MKICDVTQFYSPVSGGVKRYLTEKRDYLLQHTNHQHVVIVPGPHNSVERDGRSTIYHVRGPRVSNTSYYRFIYNTGRVEQIICNENPDLIEAGEPYQLAWTCLRAGKRIEKPVVGFYHSHFPESYLRTVTRFAGKPVAALVDSFCRSYIRRLYGKFALTLVASSKLENILTEIGLSNVRMAPLGVETDVFVPEARDMEWRRHLGIRDRQILLLFVGRLAREKKIDCLIEAFSIVQRYAGDRFALLIVGEGSERARVDEARSLMTHLYWLPYEGIAEKLARVYASADIFIHAGMTETFGLVALESQACGTPAIVIRGSGMEDNVFGGPDFLAEKPNPESIAKAILRAYQNDLREVGFKTREMVIQRYPWTTVFAHLLGLYQEIVNPPSVEMASVASSLVLQ